GGRGLVGWAEVVGGLLLGAGGVLDRPAAEADARGEPDRLRRRLRRVAEALLEIRRHRKLGGRHNRATVRERFVTRDRAVASSEHAGLRAAGGRQRGKAERAQRARGSGVPCVGDDERARSAVKRAKRGGLVGLTRRHHGLLGRAAPYRAGG